VALELNELDKAFPTVIRYVGLLTTLALIGFSLAGLYVQAAPGFVAAGGMILYKTVREAAQEGGERETLHRKKGDDLSDW
jgi:hypothetical protein